MWGDDGTEQPRKKKRMKIVFLVLHSMYYWNLLCSISVGARSNL